MAVRPDQPIQRFYCFGLWVTLLRHFLVDNVYQFVPFCLVDQFCGSALYVAVRSDQPIIIIYCS